MPDPEGPPHPPAPPRQDPSHIARRLTEVKQKLAKAASVDVTAQRALQYAHRYLDRASRSLESGNFYRCDRFTDAADGLLHVAEHQQHLRGVNAPKAPAAGDPQTHLQRVYFRTQQASYFLEQSHDPDAQPFPKWAQDFYQLAVRASERHDLVAVDENAKSAEDLVRVLENLAQAASPNAVPPSVR